MGWSEVDGHGGREGKGEDMKLRGETIWVFFLFVLATGNRFHTKLKSTVTIKVTLVNGLDLGGYGIHVFLKNTLNHLLLCAPQN